MKEKLAHAIRTRLSNERNQEGVTLIELLAVIVILAIIAAIAVPAVLGSVTRSKVSVTQQNMSVIVGALHTYAMDHNGQYPVSPNGNWVDMTTWGNLTNPLTAGDANNGGQPYLKAVPNDGWGNHFYYYSSNGTGFIIRTADGSAGVLTPNTGSNSESWWENSKMTSPSNNFTGYPAE
jgi:general secretion pathway protein G